MRTIVSLPVAVTLGILGVLFLPSEFVLAAILVPCILCIVLAWYVAVQSKAIRFTPFRLFFWPWIDVTAPLEQSRALRAVRICAALAAGACLGLLIQMANA